MNVDLTRNIVYECIAGSHAYGLSTPTSDLDVRGVYVAPASAVWSLVGPQEQFAGDGDSVYWEIGKFVRLALQNNPNILEVLYAPEQMVTDELLSPIFKEMLDNRSRFLSKRILKTYGGYATDQMRKFEKSRQGGEADWKNAMHLIRLLICGFYALENGELLVDVEPKGWRDYLLEIRQGKRDVDWLLREAEHWNGALRTAYEDTQLPEGPDVEWANDYLIRVRALWASQYITERATGWNPSVL